MRGRTGGEGRSNINNSYPSDNSEQMVFILILTPTSTSVVMFGILWHARFCQHPPTSPQGGAKHVFTIYMHFNINLIQQSQRIIDSTGSNKCLKTLVFSMLAVCQK